MARTRLDLNEAIQSSNAALLVPMELPTTKRECCLRLRQAKGEVKEIVAASYEQRERERKKKIVELEMSGNVRKSAQARLLRRL